MLKQRTRGTPRQAVSSGEEDAPRGCDAGSAFPLEEGALGRSQAGTLGQAEPQP